MYGCEVLPVGRIGLKASNDPLRKPNFYLFNLLHGLKPEIDPQSLVNKSLSAFLNDYFPYKDKTGNAMPQVLIIDQLEEMFSFYPNAWPKQRENFFHDVADALDNNSFLRILFIMREDFLAQLDPFLDILPERLRPRFRLERLDEEAALLAIKGPLKNMNVFDKNQVEVIDSEIKKLVEDLLKMRVETYDGQYQEVRGVFVEPIQLQVVCQRWWQDRLSLQNTTNSKTRTVDLGDIDKALEDFYVDTISEAAKQIGLYEQDIRKWCEQKLITSSGTRAIVHRGSELTAGMSNTVVDILEDRYLIRAEWRAGAKWYELTHDRLIGPIVNSNKIYQYSDKKYGKRSLNNISEDKKYISEGRNIVSENNLHQERNSGFQNKVMMHLMVRQDSAKYNMSQQGNVIKNLKHLTQRNMKRRPMRVDFD